MVVRSSFSSTCSQIFSLIRVNAVCLISHFFKIPLNNVEKLYISEYKILLEQAMNIGNLYRQAEFSLTDSEDKRDKFLGEIEFFKKKGKLK
jgi:hypothetical protein